MTSALMSTVPNYRLPNVEHQILMVTPALATRWLDCNTHNRKLRPGLVAKYARDIAQGRWVFDGAPVRISEKEVLLDGQHRLRAIVQTGIAVPLLVVWQLPDGSQDTMDTGSKRSMADQLGLSEEANAATLAAILNKLVAYYSGDEAMSSYQPTFAEMREFLQEYPEARFSADVARKAVTARLPCPQSAIGAAHFICAQIDRQAANEFYETQLAEGLGLQAGDPALTLNRRIRYEADQGRRLSDVDVVRYCFSAWNHYRAGNRVSKLQAPAGGWSGVPTPK